MEKRILQPDGNNYAFLCETHGDVNDLPFYYLCGLQEQTHYADPLATVGAWMAGPFCAIGLTKYS